MTKDFLIRGLPDKLHKRLMDRAVRQGTSMNKVVISILSNRKKRKPTKTA